LISADDPSPAGLSTGLEALARGASDIEAKHARRSLQQQMFGEGGPVTIDRYTITRKLGSGGMGIVYAAHDPELDREVAIKVLRSTDDRRLLREAEALAKLTHPNVVQVFAIGTDAERPFIVMELVHGKTLDRWQRDIDSTQQLLDIYLQVGEGLVAAHEAGLVHRDFKPQNVLVGDDGRPRVLDFGLARAADLALITTAPDTRSGDYRPTAIDKPITRRGAVLGTLAYMAPEQFRGEEATALADQYAYCLALWEAVYGAQPFPTHSVARMMTAREDGELAPPPIGARVPRWLRTMLARGLAPSPSSRYPTLRALLDDIRRRRDRRRRRAVFVMGGAAMALVGTTTLLALPERERGCEVDPNALHGAWDEARRAEVIEAVRATPLAGAAEIERILLAGLDAYAEQWQASWVAACEATRDAALDASMACLQRRRVELGALTEVLASADAAGLANATNAVEGLPAPATCEGAATTRVVDPALQPDIDAIREALASATALRDIGKHDEGLAAADALVDRAYRVGDPQIIAEVRNAHAQVLHRLGRELEANASFREAYLAATEAGDDALAVMSAAELMETLVVSAQAREEADRWRNMAEASAARLPDPELVRCEILMRYGRILEQSGAVREARAALEEAVEIRKRKRGPRHESLRFTLSYLAMIMMQDGDAEAARAVHVEALSIAEETLGPHHTDLARLLVNAAGADFMTEKFEDAKAKVERARALFLEGGPGHAYDLGLAEINLGLIASMLDDGPGAIAHAKRAVEVLSAFPTDPRYGAAIGLLADLQRDFGDPNEALVTIQQALRVLGTGANDKVCDTNLAAAAILQELGRMKESETHIEEAERCRDPGVQVREAMVKLWCAAGRPDRAEPHVKAQIANEPDRREEFERTFAECSR
jgi:tetratricopeptide (TPR) repeat protein/predicted Ser/Thr protein kinase